jgi:hypothetical protein
MTALRELYNCTHAQLVTHVCRTFGVGVEPTIQFMHPHRMRRETIARRLRLYRDQATIDVEAIISQIYETEEYQRTLKRYVPIALEQNVTRRIIDEVASLYDRPVLRMLKDESKMPQFRAEEKRLHLHELAQEGHRLLTLCNEVLQWWHKGADGKGKIRLVTPDVFDAVPHPMDSLVAAGFLIDMAPTTHLTGESKNRLPHFELWDDTYRYLISASGQLVDKAGTMIAEPEEHELGRIPGVLMHRREPTTAILDASHGSDIESCHLGVALLNVMIMRISKSQGENQPVLQGNLAAMATGQVMNGERPLALPPEVVASVLNTKTDSAHYLAVKRDKITSVSQTYGMSYEQFSNSESGDSGKLYAMRREKLKEIRNESRRRAVMHEGEMVALMGFDAEGLRLDYQEQSMPQDAGEKLALLKDKMKMGLDSPIKYFMREDTDKSREEAVAEMRANLEDFGDLIQWQRQLNAPADADAENPGKSPQENGAANQPSADGHDYAKIAKEILDAA